MSKLDIESPIMGLIFIIIGVALVPVLFLSLGSANWTLAVGDTSYDLGWVGYVLGLVFAVALVVQGIRIMKMK